MIEFICLFFPACISLSILERIDKKKEIVEKINRYTIYNIMINIVTLFIVSYFNNFEVVMFDSTAFTMVFSLKYLALSSITGLMLPYATNYVRKSFKLEIKREKSK